MKRHISCMCAIFPNVRLHMSSQIACFNRCKVTIVADVRNFSIKWFSNVFSNRLVEQMQSHISCKCVIFSNVSFHVSSQIACLNRCKVTIVACLRSVCHKIVHVLLCSGGFSVAPLSLFIKWLWPNYFVFSIYTNLLKPSSQAKYIDLDQKSEFPNQDGQSPPDPSWFQEKS